MSSELLADRIITQAKREVNNVLGGPVNLDAFMASVIRQLCSEMQEITIRVKELEKKYGHL